MVIDERDRNSGQGRDSFLFTQTWADFPLRVTEIMPLPSFAGGWRHSGALAFEARSSFGKERAAESLMMC